MNNLVVSSFMNNLVYLNNAECLLKQRCSRMITMLFKNYSGDNRVVRFPRVYTAKRLRRKKWNFSYLFPIETVKKTTLIV